VNACEVKADLIGLLANNSASSVSGSLYSLGCTWLLQLLLSCVTVCVCVSCHCRPAYNTIQYNIKLVTRHM